MNALEELENLLLTVNLDSYELLLCGDLNARTETLDDFVSVNINRLGHDLNKGEFTFHSSNGSSVITLYVAQIYSTCLKVTL